MEDIKKEKISYERVGEILRARLRREGKMLGLLCGAEIFLQVLLVLCCAEVKWHPVAIVLTVLTAALVSPIFVFWFVCYRKASVLVKNGRYRVVCDTLSHIVPDCRANYEDMNYKMLLRGNFFGRRYLAEVWFQIYGCVRVAPTALRYPFAGEPYYLVVTDEAPYEVLYFFDAKYYAWKEEAPRLH